MQRAFARATATFQFIIRPSHSILQASSFGHAVAQDLTAAPTPYHVDWTADLAITGGTAALWLVVPLLGREVIRPV